MAPKATLVHVCLSTEHTTPDKEIERHQTESSGKAWLNREWWVVRFVEQEGSRKIGMTTIKAADERVTVIRRGAVTMRQVFDIGKQTSGMYSHPYGRMEMLTRTDAVRRRELEDEWIVQWRYRLNMNGVETGAYHMTLTIKAI